MFYLLFCSVNNDRREEEERGRGGRIKWSVKPFSPLQNTSKWTTISAIHNIDIVGIRSTTNYQQMQHVEQPGPMHRVVWTMWSVARIFTFISRNDVVQRQSLVRLMRECVVLSLLYNYTLSIQFIACMYACNECICNIVLLHSWAHIQSTVWVLGLVEEVAVEPCLFLNELAR